MKFKQGAMFGLDARIALAIFGALSVISGAALYSIISNIQSERYRQYLVEMIKASEQYLLDNQKYLPQDNDYRVNISDLINNRESLTSWNGPYISGSVYSTNHIKNSTTAGMHNSIYNAMYVQKISEWADDTTLQKCTNTSDSDCAEYIVLHANGNSDASNFLKELFTKLDNLVDSSDGTKAGKVRFIDQSTEFDFLLYQGILRKRTI